MDLNIVMGQDASKVFNRINRLSQIRRFKEDKREVDRSHRFKCKAALLNTKIVNIEKKTSCNWLEDIWPLKRMVQVDPNLKVQQENILHLKIIHSKYNKLIITVKIEHFQGIIQLVTSCFPVEDIFSLMLSTFLLNRNVPAHSFGRSE